MTEFACRRKRTLQILHSPFSILHSLTERHALFGYPSVKEWKMENEELENRTMTTRIKFTLLKSGHCFHPEIVTRSGGSWRSVEFPALCALLEHPTRGAMLYDTGYARHFHEATHPFPYRLYRWVTPVHLNVSLTAQLAQRGLQPEDITTLLISHFHGDHVAGLRDFPRAHFIAMQADYEAVRHLSGWRALQQGFLPALLPHDFAARVSFAETTRRIALPQALQPFTEGYDLFGDASLIAVALPGHVHTQMGLLFRDQHDAWRLLVADAAWSRRAIEELRYPSFVTRLLFADTPRYRATLANLHQLCRANRDLTLVPSHCTATWQELGQTNV
jgi:glyoxylase-like metal-dependent hydrolase (beta-lactamase superfamily II)